jgi:fibulin 1/2
VLQPVLCIITDIDECQQRSTNRCHFTQICENLFGSYRCFCHPGYKSKAIGKRCVGKIVLVVIHSSDLQELRFSLSKWTRAHHFTFSVLITAMYTGAWVNVMVLFADINECVEDPPVCSHQCRNVKGSFKCLCPRGYVLLEDGRTCSGMCSCTGFFCLLVCSVHVSVITSVHTCGFGHVILELQIIFLGK